MNVDETSLPGVLMICTDAFEDSRGSFARLFCETELKEVIGQRTIVQINYSMTKKIGAIRGMHFQYPPKAELKLVRCLKGCVFDVAVDLRRGSPTFLKWTAIELSQENRRAIVIPEGCAHGFQVLQKDSELLYLHTEFYSPDFEGGVPYDDPKIGIDWPLIPSELSERDLSYVNIDRGYEGILL